MGKTSKVVVCGAKKCGKTSILEQAINGNFGVSTYSSDPKQKMEGKYAAAALMARP